VDCCETRLSLNILTKTGVFANVFRLEFSLNSADKPARRAHVRSIESTLQTLHQREIAARLSPDERGRFKLRRSAFDNQKSFALRRALAQTFHDFSCVTGNLPALRARNAQTTIPAYPRRARLLRALRP